jgi:undecaprenyl-diphosphatase
VTVFQALILGIAQGLTEFLPISSSGHLVILQQWFGLDHSLLAFDVFLHMGTLIAILLFFGRSLLKVTLKEWLLVGLGTVPAVIIGLAFKDEIEVMFAGGSLIGLELIVTGLINFYLDFRLERMKAQPTPTEESVDFATLHPLKAIGIGLAQAIAIIPAISRSGSTVTAGVMAGLNRETAFRYSFLLAIPALAGAGVLQLKDVLESGGLQQIDPVTFGVGGVAALLSGLLSLGLFRYVIQKAKLQWFGWYCVILGAFLLWQSL